MTERWLPVKYYVGLYEVSDLGRVRSLVRGTKRGKRGGRVLKPVPTPPGYLYVLLSKPPNLKRRNLSLHRLVLEAFVGPCPDGMEARHFPDNDPANCKLVNLSWGTRSQNMRDKAFCTPRKRSERQTGART